MIELPLPSLGPDMESGTLLEWRIRPGEHVAKGQVIAVVDTTKAAIDVESWHEGEVLELLAAPGAQIAVGTPIARLRTPDEAVAEPPPAAPPPPAARPQRASPAARTRARELGVDLAGLQGSGPGGAITLEDVQRAVAPGSAGAATAGAIAAAPPAAAPPAGLPPPPAAPTRAAGVRAAIAAAMTRSKREIPHYYLWDEVDVSRALDWLAATNAARPVTERLLPAALWLAAVARAASEFPDMNGTHDGTRYLPGDGVHLGVAVALRGGGLIAPALRDAQRMTLAQLMRSLADLVDRARTGGLRSSEVSGQTLTVTSLGEDGVEGLLGVIHPPQVALVGFGRVAERARVEAGAVLARRCVTISLAADHRVSDGRRGALFLARIAALLQRPEEL